MLPAAFQNVVHRENTLPLESNRRDSEASSKESSKRENAEKYIAVIPTPTELLDNSP